MTALLTAISITSMVLYNGISNKVCKKELNERNLIYFFNIISYMVCITIFGILLIGNTLSLYTLILSVIFGIVTALSNFYKMQALTKGPMNITLLVTTSSMIIPTMSGIFFGEKFSLMKLLMVMILIVFIYISLGDGDDAKANKKWLLYCALAFVFQGGTGVLQKVHQSSAHKEEVSGFLFVAFIVSMIYNRLRISGRTKKLTLSKKNILLALVCGLCVFCMNYLNLMLSGILPSQLFFPLVNGSSIVLSFFVAVIIFKEIPTKKQVVGLVGGILSLIAICLVK